MSITLFTPGLDTLLAQGAAQGADFGYLPPVRGVTEEVEMTDAIFALHGAPAGGPVAALEALAEWGEADGVWLRADPVHMSPLRTRMTLLPPSALGLSLAEASELLDLLNSHFGPEGLRFEAAEPWRWYARLPDDMALSTPPWWQVAGQDVSTYAPRGPQARAWQRLMTEIQMVLHTASVNQRRGERGQRAANGVWLWGGGRLPSSLSRVFDCVVSDEPLQRGLAQLTGAQCLPLGVGMEAVLGLTGEVLLAFDNPRELFRNETALWYQDLAQTERQWFKPLLAAVKSGRIAGVRWETGTRRVDLTARSLATGWGAWISRIFGR